jgi:5-methylcytosine-specific restriction endonuclease McrA
MGKKPIRVIQDDSGNTLFYCSGCKRYLPKDEFSPDNHTPHGYRYSCMGCENLSRRVIGTKPPTVAEIGFKTCTSCGEYKPVSEYRLRSGTNHYQSWCKQCASKKKVEADRKKRHPKKKKYTKPVIYDTCPMCHAINLDGKICNRCLSRIEWEQVQLAKDKVRKEYLRNKKFSIQTCPICGITSDKVEFDKKNCKPCQMEIINKKNRESRKKRYDSDPEYKEKLLTSAKTYQKANRPKIAKQERARRAANPDKAREKERNRENRKKNIPGHHSEQEWRTLMEISEYKCVFCGNVFHPNELTRDHIIPVTWTELTSDYIFNIQCACRSCNSSKGNSEAVDRRPRAAIDMFGTTNSKIL